jgi:DNA-directed RNA polymerase specialized sigma24 family protein
VRRTFSARDPLRLDLRPAPGPDFTQLVELRDFLSVHLQRLSPKQRSAIVAFAQGRSCREISTEEGVSERAVQLRLADGLRRLRQLAGAAA